MPIIYSPVEMMVAAAARILEDKKIVFVGTGMPIIASIVAKRLYCPNLLIIFEAGGIDPLLDRLTVSVGSSCTIDRAIMATSMDYIMSLAQRGYVDYGFLGAAQIDKYGNINTTVIGDWRRPSVRLPGSGGANDVGSLSWKTITIMKQDKLRFVDRVDYVTTPGYLNGPGSRENSGLPINTGPYRVVTQIGVYGFHPETKEMMLLALYPNTTLKDVEENSSFKIIIPERVEVLDPPTIEELKVMREIDPTGIIIPRR
jgi:acyl CoA:acetate/3-ketoacid CoA transferase beta subunit